MPKPNVLSETIIVVMPAQQMDAGKWQASAIIQWPDGSCDVGASNLDGTTKAEAEARALAKAEDRWDRIENQGTMHKSHGAPGSVGMFLKP